MDIADSFKESVRNVILGGAAVSNTLGASIDKGELDERIHKICDWQYGTRLSSHEIRKLEEAYQKEAEKSISEIAAKDGLDLSSSEDYAKVISKCQYLKFFEGLQKAIDEGVEGKASLQAALHIYKAHYLKEAKEAKEQNRAVKEFSSLIKEVNQNVIYKNPAFGEKIKHYLGQALADAELLTYVVVKENLGYNSSLVVGVSAGEQAQGGILEDIIELFKYLLNHSPEAKLENISVDSFDDKPVITEDNIVKDANSQIQNPKEAKYFIKVIFDVGVAHDSDTIVISSLPIGHYYFSLLDMSNPSKLEQSYYGKNPQKQSPIAVGIIETKKEERRYKAAKIYEAQTGHKVVTERYIPLTQGQYLKALNYANKEVASPRMYIATEHDCIKFTNQALGEAGVNADVSKATDSEKFMRSTLAKISALSRSAQHLDVKFGISEEAVAREYNIPVSQVLEIDPLIRCILLSFSEEDCIKGQKRLYR
jgi:hypothetical protein